MVLTDLQQRKTAELADGWKRRQDLKKNKFELDESRLERLPIELWEVADVLMWLDRVNLSHLKTAFDENNIDGPALIEVSSYYIPHSIYVPSTRI